MLDVTSVLTYHINMLSVLPDCKINEVEEEEIYRLEYNIFKKNAKLLN